MNSRNEFLDELLEISVEVLKKSHQRKWVIDEIKTNSKSETKAREMAMWKQQNIFRFWLKTLQP